MAFQDIVAVLALVAALITVPAGVLAYRASRRDSQTDHFKETLARLRMEQATFNSKALDESPETWRLGNLPILGEQHWLLEVPIDIRAVELVRAGDWAQPTSEHTVPQPIKAKAECRSYSELVRELGGMGHLFNGRIYRLIAVGPGLSRMDFRVARYFDYLDTSEVLAYESAERATTDRSGILKGPYRRSLGDPFTLRNRVASLGINTLTIRLDGSHPTFILHERDPSKVAVDSALISVAPAGEFTPSNRTLESIDSDFNLWRNIMREFAEEYLGEEEARGQGGRWIEYASSSPYVELQRGLDQGTIRCWVLGMGLDPLNWKPEMLSVCVLDSAVFDEVFAEMVTENDEGLLLVGPQGKGLPFNEPTVLRYATAEQTAPSTKACLNLAWKHRALLGIGAARVSE